MGLSFTLLWMITAAFRPYCVSFANWHFWTFLIRILCLRYRKVPSTCHCRTLWRSRSLGCFCVRRCSLFVLARTRSICNWKDCQRVFNARRLLPISRRFGSRLTFISFTSRHFNSIFANLYKFNLLWIFARFVGVVTKYNATILCICMILNNLNAHRWDCLVLYMVHRNLGLNFISERLVLPACLCCDHWWIHSSWRRLFLNSETLLGSLLTWRIVVSYTVFSHRTGEYSRFSDIFSTHLSHWHNILSFLMLNW